LLWKNQTLVNNRGHKSPERCCRFTCHVFVFGIIAETAGLLTDNFLLVADEDGDKILQVDTETMMTHRQPITVTPQPQVLAYDWRRRDIYWTSGRQRQTIFKYSFTSNETSELYRDTTSGQRIKRFVFCKRTRRRSFI